MPKPPHLPKYRLHKASGQAFVQVKGRRTYLGKYDSDESRERYGRIIAELTANPLALERSPRGDPLAVVQLCAAYWDFCQGYYVKNGVPSGWLAHIKLMLRLVREHYAHMSVADFGPLAFKALRQKLVDAGHSRVYVNKLMPVVKRMFKWGVAEELVPAGVYHALQAVEGLRKGRTPAHETAPVLPVSDEVVDATLPWLPEVVADMVRLQRACGCRPGELCLMRPCDIDRSVQPWAYVPMTHKTEHHGKQRIIYLGPQAQQVLLPYLLRDSQAFIFSPAESQARRHEEMRAARKSPVQPSQRHRRKARPVRPPKAHYTKDSYAKAIRRAIEKTNKNLPADQRIEFWAPNRLRHSVATRVRREFGLEAAQVVLGHSKADVTQVYAERDGRLAADIMRRIG